MSQARVSRRTISAICSVAFTQSPWSARYFTSKGSPGSREAPHDLPYGGLHKRRDVLPQFFQRLALDVNHMPGIKLPGGDVGAQSRVKAEVGQGIIHSIERRGEIEV